MTSATRFNPFHLLHFAPHSLPAFTACLAIAFLAGCGGSSTPTPALTGNTSLTLLASSTANDRLSEVNIDITGITLMSQSGKTVTLLASNLYPEFIHVNGPAVPLLTVSVPQDVYTSATVTSGGGEFDCISVDAAAKEVYSATFQANGVSSTAVTFPSPITIAGTSMGLSLDLLVTPSVSFSNCLGGVGVTFSITPAFNLTPVMIAAQPTNSLNGKGTGMQGLIASVDASGGRFSVNGADGPNLNGPTWPVSWNASAVFQGIGSGSQLVPGMPVDMDVSVQADGSLMATRVAVYDTDTSDLNVFSGPVVLTQASLPIFLMPGQQQEGILDESGYYGGSFSVDHSSAVFQISSALSNLGSLPFPANFDAANLVPGQNVSVTSHIASWSGNPLPAATVTLMPQTINGTVNAVSSEGGFTAYTVELANYDLFPDIATLPNLPVVLNNPGTVVVYADSSTQMLNSESAAAGSVLRFYGLVFDDNGTLRMVCAQINDGVAE